MDLFEFHPSALGSTVKHYFIPMQAYKKAEKPGTPRDPRLERVIARDPELAYAYARYMIRGRWPAGEAAIATQAYASYVYARDVIKGRFPEGEDAMKERTSLTPVIGSWYDRYLIMLADLVEAEYKARTEDDDR